MAHCLRRTSLDELPQLWNVLKGDVSFVGPRPALPSQQDLLALCRQHGVTPLKHGLTGLAQVLGREDLTLHTKVRCEARRLNTRPRKTLGYRTPAAVLERDVALTGRIRR